MKLIVKCCLFLITITLSFGKNCDKLGILLYEDLGCTPHYEDHKSCPTKYICPNLDIPKDKCNFRGKSYTNGEFVNKHLLVPPCDENCMCSTHSGRGKFICPVLDCAEWLGGSVFHQGCYGKYAVDECCSTGQICPPFDDSAKCVVDGKEYKKGEKFTPPNSCMHCVCQKGFQGKFEEPFCKRLTCNVQLRHAEEVSKNCAPFYGRKTEEVLCCPYIRWICPDGTEEIKGKVKSENTCKFGDKTLKVGQKIEKINFKDSYGATFDKIKCKCVIPPLLTCTEGKKIYVISDGVLKL